MSVLAACDERGCCSDVLMMKYRCLFNSLIVSLVNTVNRHSKPVIFSHLMTHKCAAEENMPIKIVKSCGDGTVVLASAIVVKIKQEHEQQALTVRHVYLATGDR